MSNFLLDSLVEQFKEIALLESTHALLEWDERTGLPGAAGGYRAAQITQLSGMIHSRRVAPQLGEQLAALLESDLATDPTSAAGATIHRLWKDYQRNTKLPVDLVEAISKATVLGQQAWEVARRQESWGVFQPHMETLFSLRKQEAELLREDHESLYDVLLDRYEEGARAGELSHVFASLRDGLIELVRQLENAPQRPSGQCWRVPVAIDQQRAVSRWVAESIGYRFDRGRLDETTHPFCTTLGPDDCRILTRYQQDWFPTSFFGTLHEAGHGLYEQGLPQAWYGLPPGQAASLGIHESQSRMWENFVGRSAGFWEWAQPRVSKMVGGAWEGFTPQDLFQDANLIQPSLIRVEADEVTYNLHILIRFELEQELMDGRLEVCDAPEAWNQRYEHYLGIQPMSAKEGILQDVHWSAGLVGYFPTYTLGNLYAAQLMLAAERDLGPLEPLFEKGQFSLLLEWLRQNIHAHGFTKSPVALLQQTTGSTLQAEPLLSYLKGKLYPLYGLA